MTIRILPGTLKLILEKQSSIKSRTDVKNDHPVMTPFLPRLQHIAEALGINFEATRYTFTVDMKKDGVSRIVYSPYVALYNDVPALYWGVTRTPLSALKIAGEVVAIEDRPMLEFMIPPTADNQEPMFLAVSLVLAKDTAGATPDITAVKTAMRTGRLGSVLGSVFTRPHSLAQLPPGAYEVKGYSYDSKFDKYGIEVFTLQGDYVGVYKANAAIAQYLVDTPEITPDAPASLEVFPVEQHTSSGYAIVPVSFQPQSFKDLPVFSF